MDGLFDHPRRQERRGCRLVKAKSHQMLVLFASRLTRLQNHVIVFSVRAIAARTPASTPMPAKDQPWNVPDLESTCSHCRLHLPSSSRRPLAVPNKKRLVELRIPSIFGYEKVAMVTVMAVAARLGMSGERAEDLRTAVAEACINAI